MWLYGVRRGIYRVLFGKRLKKLMEFQTELGD
jgi:hypothetical protein